VITEHPLLRRIAEDLEIVGPRTIAHRSLGNFEAQAGGEAVVAGAPGEGGSPSFWRLIYLLYHAKDSGGAECLRQPPRPLPLFAREDPQFADRLDAANAGAGFYHSGWTLIARDDAWLRVRRLGLTLRATETDVRVDESHAGARLEVGAAVQVRFPKSQRYAYPGCYLAIGDAGICRTQDGPLVRLYYAPRTVAASVQLMNGLTRTLNRRAVPFQIKTINHPSGLVRRDSFVLYLAHDAWVDAREQLARLHGPISSLLHDDTAGFALRLAQGWGYAEEPRGGLGVSSFGQHRSKLASEGLRLAWLNRATSAEDKLEWLATAYRNQGLDVARLHRNPQ
jgi:HopA1 effector protein family